MPTLKEKLVGKIKPALNENAMKVLSKRYLKKDNDGNPIEEPNDLFFRVAENIAQADKIYDKSADTDAIIEEFFTMMANLDFLPNSPTLMNAGRPLQNRAGSETPSRRCASEHVPCSAQCSARYSKHRDCTGGRNLRRSAGWGSCGGSALQGDPDVRRSLRFQDKAGTSDSCRL